MKIQVASFHEYTEGVSVVFKCDVGNGIGLWANTFKPILGCQYDVELDVEKTIDQVQVSYFKDKEYSLSLEGAAVILKGEIESIESDGMAYLRLSQDCLIMIEQGATSIEEGCFMMLTLGHFDLKLTAIGV